MKIQGGLKNKCKATESMEAILCEHESQALTEEEYFKLDDGKRCMCLCEGVRTVRRDVGNLELCSFWKENFRQ